MKIHKYSVAAIIVIFLTALSSFLPVFAIDYLRPADFQEESWFKTIDYLEYVDVYAATHGLPRPPAGAHAYLYMTYVNNSGVQMLYAGLSNITMGLGALSVTMPLQTYMVHYKTEDQGRDVVQASSYIMLLAYNETEGDTIHPDSPDKNDTLYASFSMGFDLSSLIPTDDRPALNSETTTLPLTQPEANRWRWGMSYTNLTAIWWQMRLDPNNLTYTPVPVAVSVYEELTFTYDLVFDVAEKTAKVYSTYTIGRMTDLLVIDTWLWFIPVVVHYNSTGCHYLNGTLYSDETIHQFLNDHGISMSMVFFQATATLDHITESTVNGADVAENEVVVRNTAISTFIDDGEKISDVDFSEKSEYTLYNHTSDSSTSYSIEPRTAERQGFAKNPIFRIQTFLMRYIPLALAHMDRPLYEQAKNKLLNMTYADYFYIISYPIYDGYKIEHDPVHTIYFTPAALAGPNIGGLIALIAIASILIVLVAVILRKFSQRKMPTGPSLTSS